MAELPAVPRKAVIQDLIRSHWPLWVGLAALAIPTTISLGQQVWATEIGAQGPIILFTGFWLLYRKADQIRVEAVAGASWLTALMAVVGLALYIFGRAYDFISIEVAGLYALAVSYLHAYVGFRVLLKNWFPLFYLGFIIPPPGWLIDSITAPLKTFVSYAATGLLQLFGVPIVREGVSLIVAQYQMLVEDACSGMNSLNGLIAISLFYIYLSRGSSWKYSVFLTGFVIPIAIMANIIRIIILVLLTYFFGDGVAQGFLHVTAGLFLFAVALLMVFGVDHLAASFLKRRRAAA